MLTAIWRREALREKEWITEIFGSMITEHIIQGDEPIVMDNCLLIDQFIHCKETSDYAPYRKSTNAFLLHLSDEQFHGGYEVYKNFAGVFRNYWSSVFNPSNVMVLPLGYSNGISGDPQSKLASERKYLWSFAGETARASRPEMLAALRGISPHLCCATDRKGSSTLAPDKYRELLRESVFAPCPMGRLNLECFRLYEALECGAIPIVEQRATLDYFTRLLGPNPILAARSWTDGREKLRRLAADPREINQLQQRVASWWSLHKKTVRRQILEFVTDRQASDSNTCATSWSYNLPFWQIIELARHQSGPAMVRRIGLQAGKLLAGHPLRGA